MARGYPSKEVRELVVAARKAGWRIKEGNHFKLYSPDGRSMVVLPGTPAGGKRGLKNVCAELRRAGLDI